MTALIPTDAEDPQQLWEALRSALEGGPALGLGMVAGAPENVADGIAAVIAGALAIGLFLPLVGYTLAAFVVLDVIIGLVQRRRQEVRS